MPSHTGVFFGVLALIVVFAGWFALGKSSSNIRPPMLHQMDPRDRSRILALETENERLKATLATFRERTWACEASAGQETAEAPGTFHEKVKNWLGFGSPQNGGGNATIDRGIGDFLVDQVNELEAELAAAALPTTNATEDKVGDNFNPVLAKEDFTELVLLVSTLLEALHEYRIGADLPEGASS